MRFFTLATLGFLSLAAGQNTSCPPRHPDGFIAGAQLSQWMQDSITAFFPYRPGWEAAYDEAFSPNVHASMNATLYTFDTFKQAYRGFYVLLSAGFAGTFQHGFLAVVGVPNRADRGGFVTLTGWQGGYMAGDPSALLNVTDAAYAVVEEDGDCNLKIVEFRESSNLGAFPF